MLVHPAVAWLTARQLLTRRRLLPVLVLCALPIGIAIAFRVWGGDESPDAFYAQLANGLVMSVIVPLMALFLGGMTFGSELEEGTAVFLIARPMPRHAILAGKAVVAVPFAATVSAVAALAPALIVGAEAIPGMVAGATIASAAGGALYTLLFMALGLVTRRGVLIGLLYIALWEGALATLFGGTRLLSIRQYMLSVTDGMIPTSEAFSATLPLSTALWMSGIVAVAALALALRRLRGFEVASAD